MVKNTSGGNKTKGHARKNFAPRSEALRLPISPDEHVARILRLFGDGRCSVLLADGRELACIIRKKFRGRLKRNNCVIADGLVLVGLREWEAPHHRICDILEVYADEDTQKLTHALPTIIPLIAPPHHHDALFSAQTETLTLNITQNTTQNTINLQDI